MTDCPVCGYFKKNIYLKNPKRKLVKCKYCSLIYVKRMPSSANLEKFYKKEYYKLTEKNNQILGYRNYDKQRPSLEKYYKMKLEQINALQLGQKGKLLDIGCAFGTFLDLADKGGWDVTGHDISEFAVSEVRKKGFKANSGLFSSKFYVRDAFDAVTLFQVIEHVPNPLSMLKEVRKVLKPNGLILVTTPDRDALLARLLGNMWHGWYIDAHITFFNKKSLEFLLKKSGFLLQHVKTDTVAWTSLADDSEALKMRYPHPFTRFISNFVSLSPYWLKTSLIIPQIVIPSLITFARRQTKL